MGAGGDDVKSRDGGSIPCRHQTRKQTWAIDLRTSAYDPEQKT